MHQKLLKSLEYEALLGGVGGAWPDWDMLMLGQVIHAYDGSAASETHLTHDEQVPWGYLSLGPIEANIL